MRGRRDSLGRLPETAVGMAISVTLIAIAYALARSEVLWAGRLYWLGEGLLFAVPTCALLFFTTSRVEGIGIALLVPLATYIVVQCYSPIQFRFLDEFIHVQTAQSILATHHLFNQNTVLPISPQYPGLEIVTTAVSFLSHLSIYASGTVVTGLAHELLGIGLYLVALEITDRPKAAGFAVIIYSTGPHFAFFDSYFIYEVIALPLLMAALLAAVKMLKAPRRSVATAWAVAAITMAMATVVSHHASSYALIGLLLCFQIAQLASPRLRRWPWHLPAVLGTTLAITLGWDLGIATATLAYVSDTIRPLVSELTSAFNPFKALFGTSASVVGPSRGAVPTATSSAAPRPDQIAEYLGYVALLVLGLLGGWRVWRARKQRREPLLFSCALGGLGLLILFTIRLVANDGSELAGRASSYVWIPLSVTTAIALRYFGAPKGRGRSQWYGRLSYWGLSTVFLVAVVLVAVGGLAGGWPPYYARLPGPFRVAAWERSVDEHNLMLSQWTADHLPPDSGVAADEWTAGMLAALGHEAEPSGVAKLFLATKFSEAQVNLVERERISFIAVDTRMSQQLPAAGYYFSDDPASGSYATPIPVASLEKFNFVPGVSRLFDDGTLQLYDLVDSLYTKR